MTMGSFYCSFCVLTTHIALIFGGTYIFLFSLSHLQALTIPEMLSGKNVLCAAETGKDEDKK